VHLFDNLRNLSTDNAQGEYYLTDLLGVLRGAGHRVGAVIAGDPIEALGVNSRADLASVEGEIQRRVVAKLMAAGVTFRNPATVVIDSTVSIGNDTVVYPFVTIEGTTSIGSRCVIEPGVTRKALNEHLRDKGLFFPIDPGADASLGGMAATRASGTNAVRYGTMKDNVLALKAVMADGEIMQTARRAKKTAAGYDLTRLMVGSEGTLGVIVELTLKLSGIPEAIAGGTCPFPSVEACCNTAIATIQSGIPVARIELLDALQVKAVNMHSKLGLAEKPMLFLEFHGTEASVAEQSARFGEIAAEQGGGPFQWTSRPEERTKLWEARHHAAMSNFALRPGAQMIATDVCVPISRLADSCSAQRRTPTATRSAGAVRRRSSFASTMNGSSRWTSSGRR